MLCSSRWLRGKTFLKRNDYAWYLVQNQSSPITTVLSTENHSVQRAEVGTLIRKRDPYLGPEFVYRWGRHLGLSKTDQSVCFVTFFPLVRPHDSQTTGPLNAFIILAIQNHSQKNDRNSNWNNYFFPEGFSISNVFVIDHWNTAVSKTSFVHLCSPRDGPLRKARTPPCSTVM